MYSDTKSKDQFYEELDETVQGIAGSKSLFQLYDFNAREGSFPDSWPTCIGHFGEWPEVVRTLLLAGALCYKHVFYLPREFTPYHSHHLELVISRRTSLNNVIITRSFHIADCDT